ncbi:sugar phosphate isomerase/epimerase family protein [Catalinimonas niigatensis]|uniref:sugar phosphate isomerase/epimerase family protein n=1 Tax=Catalinimonas niigatensis TaxID=1397264 RepID=UPI0026663A3A|nr:sugar phosphate isomerase/epimerase [Catalinimonas niigatensis]WPP49244.1 sugar phosphate isomerase/epimerase [Catalinimonas niigatensis]
MKKILIPCMLVTILLCIALPGFSQDKFGGMTLYTLRNEMGTDPIETLKKVADIGYKYVEAVDYKDGKFYNMSPKAFKKQLNDLGMVPLSVHMGSVTLDNADKLIADVKAAGFKYFVAPVPPMGLFKYDQSTQSLSMSDNVDSLVNILRVIGEKSKAAGLEFLYHNHAFEFEENANGIVPIDYMLEKLDSSTMNFQMDLYWVKKAGADPVAYFEKYPGRFKIWHVKDMDEQGRFAPVGTGTIDFESILEHKELAGMEYYIVEQDQTYDGLAPIEAIKISHEALEDIGFN